MSGGDSVSVATGGCTYKTQLDTHKKIAFERRVWLLVVANGMKLPSDHGEAQLPTLRAAKWKHARQQSG